MASLFEIGKSGVQAYRQALSVTGQNIANVNTDGYNKRAADLEEVPSVQGGVTNVPDQSGLGVRVNKVRRSFDAFLSSNLRDTNGNYERLDVYVDKLNKLENMLLPSDSDLGTFIGRFFSSLQDVASRPDELSARTVALENGKALANSFNNYDHQLKNFKSSTHKEVEDDLKVVNSLVDQLVQVNKLIMSGGSKNSSPDILDARDQLLLDLSKYINFTVDYGESNDAIVRLGNSGNGKILFERTDKSVLSSDIQEGRLIFKVSRNGINSINNDISSGLLFGAKNFYDFVGEVESEINQLALRVSQDFNEIQQNGIDLNGKTGMSMFSINSMKPKIEQNVGGYDVDMIIGNENLLNQEKMKFKYIATSNSWEVSSSEGIKIHAAIKEYEYADINSKLEGSKKHDFIKIVLEELHKNLNSLKYAIENEGKLSKTKSKSFARIITSITILTSTLDFEKGEPIASNLFNLYDFCRREVLDSYKNLTTNGIDNSINVINDILTAWKEIG